MAWMFFFKLCILYNVDCLWSYTGIYSFSQCKLHIFFQVLSSPHTHFWYGIGKLRCSDTHSSQSLLWVTDRYGLLQSLNFRPTSLCCVSHLTHWLHAKFTISKISCEVEEHQAEKWISFHTIICFKCIILQSKGQGRPHPVPACV